MGASLTEVRAWTTEKRAKVLPKAFLVIRDGLEKSQPNLTNEVDQVEMASVVTALEEAISEETILVEETVTKASFDALQATYDAYVIAHP